MQTPTVLAVLAALMTVACQAETTQQSASTQDVFEYHEVDVLPMPKGEGGILASVFQSAQWDPMCHASGSVYLRFVVNAEGALQQLHVLHGLTEACDAMIESALLATGRWQPGLRNGEPVATAMYLRVPVDLR